MPKDEQLPTMIWDEGRWGDAWGSPSEPAPAEPPGAEPQRANPEPKEVARAAR